MKHVYMVRAGESQYKIGVTSNIEKRIKALQTSNPHKIELVTSRFVDDPSIAEGELHKSLRAVRANGGKEWFELTPEQAIQLAINLNKYQSSQTSELLALRTALEEHLVYVNRLCKRISSSIPFVKLDPPAIVKLPKMAKPDEVYKLQALEVFKSEGGKASTSLLQRRLSIGYGKASRIMDKLYAEGLISELDGVHPRQLLQ